MAEKLCLQWNDFQGNVKEAFESFRADKDFSDVTLACEDGIQFEAHKVILAASSPPMRQLLNQNKHAHPLIYMRGLNSENLCAILDFLYRGETNVLQENLESFLALAEEFQLKGLTGYKEARLYYFYLPVSTKRAKRYSTKHRLQRYSQQTAANPATL